MIPMGLFSRRVEASQGNRTLLEALDFRGLIAFDHFHETQDELIFALTSNELEIVRARGLDPEILEEVESAAQSRVGEQASSDSDDDSANFLATGFVNQYWTPPGRQRGSLQCP